MQESVEEAFKVLAEHVGRDAADGSIDHPFTWIILVAGSALLALFIHDIFLNSGVGVLRTLFGGGKGVLRFLAGLIVKVAGDPRPPETRTVADDGDRDDQGEGDSGGGTSGTD